MRGILTLFDISSYTTYNANIKQNNQERLDRQIRKVGLLFSLVFLFLKITFQRN